MERRRRFAAATAHLEQVRAAHAHVSELVSTRLDTASQQAESSSNGDSGRGSARAGAGDLVLRLEEISPSVLATLRRLGLTVSRMDALDLVSELELRLGAAHAEVSSLRRVDEVVSVGSALVRRRRVLSAAELGEVAR
ncbi:MULTISPECIES: hypothetical protein [Saccharothrix]|uniref:hypothetical protein n=1 Tax=Saccharothrix TaxID=2071 RepID=UPI00093A21C2|nr:hypothetical protein [Saccharothrix sp. CB00851]OKI18671.1 hypothetical protein A6A25_39675 [Saccharothrix sp. CB00851]